MCELTRCGAWAMSFVLALGAASGLFAADYTVPDKAQALAAVKALVAEAAKPEKKERVWVNILGKSVQANLESSDEKAFVVKFEGNLFPTKWESLSEKDMGALVKSVVQDDPRRALIGMDYAMAMGQLDKAEEFMTLAAAKRPAHGHELTARTKALNELQSAAQSPAANSASAAAREKEAKPTARMPGGGASVRKPESGPRVNPYDPNSGIDFSTYDPSIDPGVDPVFLKDPALNQTEEYAYVFTKPGDHNLPEKTCAFQYDVNGPASLVQVLSAMKDRIAGCKGVAIYLVNGTALKAADLQTVQTFNKPAKDGGLGLVSVDTLHIYNLKSLDGGVETKVEAMPGTPIRVFMWDNGWQSAAFKHLVLDDLEEVKDGTFCQNNFHSISLKGARTIGVMAFGGHRNTHPPLAALYLPSAIHLKEHAFRRNRKVITANLPKVVTMDSYAMDDMFGLKYINAPELKTVGRNTFNDCGSLVSINMPKLEFIGVACFGPNDAMTVMRLPSLIKGYELAAMNKLRFLYLPSLKTLMDGMLGRELQAVYVPKVEVVERNIAWGGTTLKKLDLPSARRVNPEAFSGMKNVEVTIRGVKKVLP